MSIDLTDAAFENGLYPDTILSGISDMIRLCAEWAKKHPGRFTVNSNEFTNEWSVTCTGAVEYVNSVFLERHKDPEFTASVWRAMYYEVPEKLVLKRWFSQAGYVNIFRRTASQQRICVTAFVSMKIVQNGWFKGMTIPENPLSQKPPSLKKLRRVQLDANNIVLLEYLSKISRLGRPFTVDEICGLGCGATYMMYYRQPLVEVMLPLTDRIRCSIVGSGALPPYLETMHIQLMEMADKRLQEDNCKRYYVTERGPSIVPYVFESAMLVSSCTFACTTATDDHDDYHHFWQRRF